ncbi:MAG: MarR family transcriptional regulator [Bacteroidetes bacterium]|nr:MAG: MarR family transcriptional regulator [Bacteroidota bacterium]
MSTTVNQTLAENPVAVERLEKSLYHLAEVYRKHQSYIKLKYNISALEMEIIQYILLDGKKKMKEIGEHFQVKLSTLTSIIDKIERQRLVKRVNSREDRRVVYLETTRKGKQLYEQYSDYMGVVSQQVYRVLDPGQFEALITGLAHMSDAMRPAESEE